MGESQKHEEETGFDVAIVGLGYVGLPLAMEATRAGLRVLGFDIDPEKIESLLEGRSHVEDIADAEVDGALVSGFHPSADASLLGHAGTVVICVPTPLTDRQPDLGAVRAAGAVIGANLRPGTLVILESTTYPGTTEEVLLPILESRSGLRCGAEFYLAYSPERIDPGNPIWRLRNTPKVVGGVDELSTGLATSFYRKVCDVVVEAPGTREAELAKLLENTYRHVNIALVNELTVFAAELGIDIWEVIRLAGTKPFGFEPFFPGPGVGGHCIPIDPNYLSHSVRLLGRQFRFVELAQEINDQMPAYVVSRAIDILNRHGKPVRDSNILLIGVSYKADIGDVRESPAVSVARRFGARGARLTYWDPHVPSFSIDGSSIERVEDAIASARVSHLTVILTAHSSLDLDALVSAAPAVLDTRGVTRRGTAERL